MSAAELQTRIRLLKMIMGSKDIRGSYFGAGEGRSMFTDKFRYGGHCDPTEEEETLFATVLLMTGFAGPAFTLHDMIVAAEAMEKLLGESVSERHVYRYMAWTSNRVSPAG